MSFTIDQATFDKLNASRFNDFKRVANTNPLVFGFRFTVTNHKTFNFSKYKAADFEGLLSTLNDLSREKSENVESGARQHCHAIQNKTLKEHQLDRLAAQTPTKTLYSLGLAHKKMRLIGFFDQSAYCFQVCLIDRNHLLYPGKIQRVFP